MPPLAGRLRTLFAIEEKMKIIFLILFILCINDRQIVFSQNINDSLNTTFDTINYENEKQQLSEFLLKFVNCEDSIKIQEFIYWPFFEVRDPKDPEGGIAHYTGKDTLIGFNGNPFINKVAFGKWIIENYNKISKSDKYPEILMSQFFNRDYLTKNHERMSNITTVVYLYGYNIYAIIKLNGAYEISYLSYIWN